MPVNTSLDIYWCDDEKVFVYGPGIFGPKPEHRRLDAIRASLCEPNCNGPDPVYSIVMDVGREEHLAELQSHMLLFGVVVYPGGRLGHEPVRSQGHVHAASPHSGWSAPELFEIWEGRAIIYAQEFAEDHPGRCVAIHASPGDHIVVPPGWAHCVINVDPHARMVFAACCDRQYGFVYDQVRAHAGLAWFPMLDDQDEIFWRPNPRYSAAPLSHHQAGAYKQLDLSDDISIYEQFARNPDSLQWVSEPSRFASLWGSFEP